MFQVTVALTVRLQPSHFDIHYIDTDGCTLQAIITFSTHWFVSITHTVCQNLTLPSASLPIEYTSVRNNYSASVRHKFLMAFGFSGRKEVMVNRAYRKFSNAIRGRP